MNDLATQIDALAVQIVDISLPQAIDLIEWRIIQAALNRHEGNVTRAAQDLGIHRNTLHNKLRTRRSELLSGLRREKNSLLRKAAKLQQRITSAASRRRR